MGAVRSVGLREVVHHGCEEHIRLLFVAFRMFLVIFLLCLSPPSFLAVQTMWNPPSGFVSGMDGDRAGHFNCDYRQVYYKSVFLHA